MNSTTGSGTMASRANKIRVLVVDDSLVIRRLITRMIGTDEELEVVGEARNGIAALEMMEKVAPDVVTMDVEMPLMDGIETLRQMRPRFSHIRVIMFSTLTNRGAAATINALMLGASDYVAKSSNDGKLDDTLASLRDELLPKIKSIALRRRFRQTASQPIRPSVAPPRSLRRIHIRAVVIGVSTGGPTALAQVMPQFPENFPLPIYIVQHMPPLFTRLLAERLDGQCRIKVREATEGMIAAPGMALVAPGNYHMTTVRKPQGVTIALNQDAPVNSCRPSVDVLFRSIFEVYGGDVIAVVLTGMGKDGLNGCDMLKQNGARIIAQDAESSVVWGMPGAVANAGLADAVLGLDEIVPCILRQVQTAL